ncbi:hypothetical protein QBC42DRAFT_264134 [Cladorrhinum samala]|uniref:Uncharacterized protein n=1 Tax=Cladorrhinum samala TaxID=585594 RepID=A0AAV9HTG6_9PEZI|nr:hypothetical protein QBC42DRAFT_264134 [Cladorrhinum samala]
MLDESMTKTRGRRHGLRAFDLLFMPVFFCSGFWLPWLLSIIRLDQMSNKNQWLNAFLSFWFVCHPTEAQARLSSAGFRRVSHIVNAIHTFFLFQLLVSSGPSVFGL